MRRSRIIPLFIGVFAFLSVGWRFSADGTRKDFGKITLAADKVLVGEMYSGIRIYDASDLRNLHAVGFIPLEGNLDAAVIDNILYADDYTDLVLFDIADPARPVAVDTIPDVFTGHRKPGPVDNRPVGSFGGSSGCAGSGCGSSTTSPVYNVRSDGGINSNRGGTAGQSGSMARFAIVDGYLYCIDATDMLVFDIRDGRNPRFIAKTSVGFGIETLFPYRNYLFIGSSTGMFIYDARDVRVPVKVSEFRHARACDPVVVEGTRAYVTLRSGARCGGVDNDLHVVDISDLASPSLLTTYPMDSPAGLAVSGGIVYVCDGANVRILDVRNESAITQLSSIALGNSYDCLVSDGVLYVVSPNGIAIYDVHDPANPVRLTMISNIG